MDNTVKIWELETGNLLETISASSPVVFSDNGQYLITGNQKNQIEIWQKISVNNLVRNCDLQYQQWWTILGIDCHASLAEIKKAYYDLARYYHPDLNSSNGSVEMMQIINHAYNRAQRQ